MKKLKRNLLVFIATVTTLIASLVASSACTYFLYQPEEPESLQEK